ncbi:hypothetical protein ACFL17_06280 [Pseudomonadota bacterium]
MEDPFITDTKRILDEWRAIAPVWPPPEAADIMRLMYERMQKMMLKQQTHSVQFPWVEESERLKEAGNDFPNKDFNPEDYLPADIYKTPAALQEKEDSDDDDK